MGSQGLSAAVSGDVFASPSSEAVYNGLQEIYSPAGSIIYVINYTGDRLNFGMAVERFKAETKNENVDLVYIDDDVALEDKTNITVGARGLAGAVLLFQIVGYLAEVKQTPFQKLLDVSREIVKNTGEFCKFFCASFDIHFQAHSESLWNHVLSLGNPECLS